MSKIYKLNIFNYYPSLSVTGVSWVHCAGPAEAEIISKNYRHNNLSLNE